MKLEYKVWDKQLHDGTIIIEEVTDRDDAIARVCHLARINHAIPSMVYKDIVLHAIDGDEGEEMGMFYDSELLQAMMEDT